tara:strand:+ start:178 stop:435 length:258 start_codon:yes stop_codon:yes gene_type:complete
MENLVVQAVDVVVQDLDLVLLVQETLLHHLHRKETMEELQELHQIMVVEEVVVLVLLVVMEHQDLVPELVEMDHQMYMLMDHQIQ